MFIFSVLVCCIFAKKEKDVPKRCSRFLASLGCCFEHPWLFERQEKYQSEPSVFTESEQPMGKDELSIPSACNTNVSSADMSDRKSLENAEQSLSLQKSKDTDASKVPASITRDSRKKVFDQSKMNNALFAPDDFCTATRNRKLCVLGAAAKLDELCHGYLLGR